MNGEHDTADVCSGGHMERRAVCRVLARWEVLRGEDLMPAEQDMMSTGVDDDIRPHIFVLAHQDRKKAPSLEMAGESFAAFCGGERLDDVTAHLPYPLNQNFTDLVRAVVEHVMPISNSGTCRISSLGLMVNYRLMMFPLGGATGTVEHVLGVIGYCPVTPL
ncbi:MAG: PAS domain-containing protein [Alphaproteobacteria bacterium]|nr:PAS domain-containing protein [Alphaproteobacteria bacterium]